MIIKTRLDYDNCRTGYKLFRSMLIRPWLRLLGLISYFILLLYLSYVVFLWYEYDGSTLHVEKLALLIFAGIAFALWGKFRIIYYSRKNPYFNKTVQIEINTTGVSVTIDESNDCKSGWEVFQSARISKVGILMAYKGLLSYIFIPFNDLSSEQAIELENLVTNHIADFKRI